MPELRIPKIRFAPEVPREKECKNCKLASHAHPLLVDINDKTYCSYHLLCTKDCLKHKIPLDYNKDSQGYSLKNMDRIQFIMKCDCTATTPKGVKYHPSCKAVYWREGASGKFIKIGHRCPNCGKWYDISVQKPVVKNDS